ncbi:MAG: cation transporter [Atopobiaceae bacterium]|nr:cation transporter [Atopobiaceae bacterium]
MVERTGSAESRTLLTSVVLSAPGPLVVGLGLLTGKSSTQLADFFRRTAELSAIICAYVIYRITSGSAANDELQKLRLERGANRFIGGMMVLAGMAMAVLAIVAPNSEKGNVVPGIVIAMLGFVANGIFWIRYTSLNRATPNAIIAVQARLYRAKTFVDGCVTAALLTVLLNPGTELAAMVDLAGSVIVSLYMVYCGIKTMRASAELA